MDTHKVNREQALDGRDIITTDVSQADMDTLEVVNAYKSLTFVERVFRNLNTVQLEIRPVYHKKDERIHSHAFLCMITYITCNGTSNTVWRLCLNRMVALKTDAGLCGALLTAWLKLLAI